MKYSIHFTYPDGAEDWFIVEADTIDEVRRLANIGIAERDGEDPWAELIEDTRP